MGDEEIVQAAGSRQPDLIGGIEHACGLPQQLAGMVESESRDEFLRRQPGPAAEQMMQIVGVTCACAGDRLDIGLARWRSEMKATARRTTA